LLRFLLDLGDCFNPIAMFVVVNGMEGFCNDGNVGLGDFCLLRFLLDLGDCFNPIAMFVVVNGMEGFCTDGNVA
jgi:hypothetical protein